MKYLKYIENFNNDYLLKELVYKSNDYDAFLQNVERESNLFILYRGQYNEYLDDKSFFGDFLSHAQEYGEYVHGIIVPNGKSDILYYDNEKIQSYRENIEEILVPNIKYDDSVFKEKLKEIYKPYFDDDKLGDAMYQLDCDKDCVIDFVYNFWFDSLEPYSKISQTKLNDFLIPSMLYIATKIKKNIISFFGADFYGSDEYVVNDVSKYVKLIDIWEKYKR